MRLKIWLRYILSNLLFGKTRIYICEEDKQEKVTEGQTIEFQPKTYMEFDKETGTYTLMED